MAVRPKNKSRKRNAAVSDLKRCQQNVAVKVTLKLTSTTMRTRLNKYLVLYVHSVSMIYRGMYACGRNRATMPSYSKQNKKSPVHDRSCSHGVAQGGGDAHFLQHLAQKYHDTPHRRRTKDEGEDVIDAKRQSTHMVTDTTKKKITLPRKQTKN